MRAWTVMASAGALALVCGLAPTEVRAEDEAALERAYRKEFAFLEAEKRALEERLAELQEGGQRRVNAAQGELQSLTGAVMGMTLQADTLMQSLEDATRKSDVAGEGAELLEATLAQAATTLSHSGIELPSEAESDADGASVAARLAAAFEGAQKLLDRYSRVRTEPGEFFAADGKKIRGEVVHVGQVAAYGVGAESGPLSPAGGGQLKLFQVDGGAATARALASGGNPSMLGLFLFESLEKDFEIKRAKTALEVVQSGGVIAWVIVGLGLLALLMLLARLGILLRNHANIEHWVQELAPLVRARRYEEAAGRCARGNTAPARVMAMTLRHLELPREQLEDLVSEQILAEEPRLDRFGQMVLVLAAVAPLLGLLGTVTGMISTFDVITEFGTGNPKLLSGGISEALVTTELGLIVAIPALLGGNMLAAWGERIKAEMDRAALRLSNLAFGKEPPAADEGPVQTVPQFAPAE